MEIPQSLLKKAVPFLTCKRNKIGLLQHIVGRIIGELCRLGLPCIYKVNCKVVSIHENKAFLFKTFGNIFILKNVFIKRLITLELSNKKNSVIYGNIIVKVILT